MIEIENLLDKYIFEAYSICSKMIPETEWGNRQMAFDYLQKYYMSEEEYVKIWRSVQDSIFQNQDKGLPALLFNSRFSLLAFRGGVLFEKEDFENLKACMGELDDKNLIIIQNNFGGTIKQPLFRMKYPASITWHELMSGNYISAAIFELCTNEYFVFSESGQWGKYSANDYINPLDIIGFKSEVASIFKKRIVQSNEEQRELREWLPSAYRKLIPFDFDENK